MTLKTTHVRIVLAVIALCGAGMLTMLLLDGSLMDRTELGGLSSALMMVLALGAVALPILGMLGSLADPGRVRSVLFLVVPLLSLAIFLDDRFNVFPVRILCLVGLVLAFIGTIAVLFNAMEEKGSRKPSTPGRFQ
ncbi:MULTISPECIES: hypothetical protein [unclassified Arthrobacter]|uniref:hypothetical protein n=1 Tax=unclassified Arthrobacter TaxID=235627 RepID=UPI002DF77791|nr:MULTISPECIES: hypothetical protein [unclassified Arthrobacter]MEC5192737.1 hypothetical protein [Arthrobacter sp. MP_M4]MEC5204220.1 hypothetical protein [Arthrobacter sp. MP_M7]